MVLKASATLFTGTADDADRRPFSGPQDGKTETYGDSGSWSQETRTSWDVKTPFSKCYVAAQT